MRATVLGGGSWGTALAMQLARSGHAVRLWERDSARAICHREANENSQYLPGVSFPEGMALLSDLEAAVTGAELVVVVVPSQAVREVMGNAAGFVSKDALVCCAAKGVEQGTLMTMDEVLVETLIEHDPQLFTVLSGPSFAFEVARDLPTAVVVAGSNEDVAHKVAEAFHGGRFRVYHSTDIIGVEMGGSLKNVMAIACGICDGAGLGMNARAALITRGLAEITRLAVARGANPLTLAGLAGMGDLVLTCTGDLSRNRRVGLALGQGRPLEEILEQLGQVAEGVVTARSGRNLGLRLGVDMPITEQIYLMLYEAKPVPEALGDLLERQRRSELD